jgi:dolichol-phosphate mannosyltransferase
MPAVLLPTYQEADNIAAMVRAVRAVLPQARILVIDDASPDGTADRAEEAGAELLRRTGPRGLGPAYRDGMLWALAQGLDPIYQMDADFSHDPADLLRLNTDADLTLGSRYVPGGGTRNWALHRQLISRFGSIYASRLLGMPVADPTGGFKCWRAATLRDMDVASVRSDGYVFQVETTFRAIGIGARLREVPIVFTERREGKSKMSTAIALEAAVAIPRLRWGRR